MHPISRSRGVHARRPLIPTIALSFVLASLVGCATSGGLEPVGQLASPDALVAVDSLAPHLASDAAFPATDWWTALGDPQLDGIIEEALRDNPSLAAADARLRQATARAGLADAQRKPTVGLSAQYSGLRIGETVAPEPIGGEYTGVELLSIGFDHSFDFWGGKRAQWDAALGQARAAEVDAQAARLALSANIARAYVALAQAYDALDVAQAEQDRATGLQDLSGKRVQAGLDNRMQLERAQSSVASARQQAQAARQQIAATRNAIAALLGQGPDRGLAITRPSLLQAPAPGVPDVLPSELLGHRPDIVAARWRAESAIRSIDASEAAFYPTVNLKAMVGLASVGLSDLFRTEAGLIQGGPAISLPIFDGGRLRARLDASDADFDLAAADYNGRLASALREVADAVQGASALDARIATTTEARDAAEQAWQLATQRYKAGLGTQLDVLAAQQPLLQLDQLLATLRAQRLVATIDLDEALGGGLELTPVPTSAH